MAVCHLAEQFMKRLLQDTAGFGACEIMRRIQGLAHVPDLECIEDEQARASAESICLHIAKLWLMERRNFSSVDNLISAIKESQTELFACTQ